MCISNPTKSHNYIQISSSYSFHLRSVTKRHVVAIPKMRDMNPPGDLRAPFSGSVFSAHGNKRWEKSGLAFFSPTRIGVLHYCLKCLTLSHLNVYWSHMRMHPSIYEKLFGKCPIVYFGNRKCSKFLLQYLGSEQLHLLWAHFVPLSSVICDESFLSIDGIFENLQFDGVPKFEIFILSKKKHKVLWCIRIVACIISLYSSVYLPSPKISFKRCELVKPGLGLLTICIVVQVVLTHMFLSQGATLLCRFTLQTQGKNSRILGPKKICIR